MIVKDGDLLVCSPLSRYVSEYRFLDMLMVLVLYKTAVLRNVASRVLFGEVCLGEWTNVCLQRCATLGWSDRVCESQRLEIEESALKLVAYISWRKLQVSLAFFVFLAGAFPRALVPGLAPAQLYTAWAMTAWSLGGVETHRKVKVYLLSSVNAPKLRSNYLYASGI